MVLLRAEFEISPPEHETTVTTPCNACPEIPLPTYIYSLHPSAVLRHLGQFGLREGGQYEEAKAPCEPHALEGPLSVGGGWPTLPRYMQTSCRTVDIDYFLVQTHIAPEAKSPTSLMVKRRSHTPR